MGVKSFLSIDNQIKLLRTRGLVIPDEKYDIANLFLRNNNYYRVSGYTLTLRKDDKFNNSISIENVIEIYEFDKRLRHAIFSVIESIEVRIKTFIAYYHAEKKGPLGYLDINNFNCHLKAKIDIGAVKNYFYLSDRIDKQKNNKNINELFLNHHNQNKEGKLPLWVCVEILTFSEVSKLYCILDEGIKINIASEFGFNVSAAVKIIENHLYSITILRNMCAHGSRLYNRIFTHKPNLSTMQRDYLRIGKDNLPIYDSLFSYLLIIKSLSLPDDFKILVEHLSEFKSKYPFVNLKYYGFPDNWQEVL